MFSLAIIMKSNILKTVYIVPIILLFSFTTIFGNSIDSKHISNNYDKIIINVAILAEEPIGWGSGKFFFLELLDSYEWQVDNKSYQFSAEYIFDKDILDGKLNVDNYDCLVIPGGGVGDGESMVKGFYRLPHVQRWKTKINEFVKSGGGVCGFCGGSLLITDQVQEPKTFALRQYETSSLGFSSVSSDLDLVKIPIGLFSLRYKYDEAASYYLWLGNATTTEGEYITAMGAAMDITLDRNHPIFNNFTNETEHITWCGGPIFYIPDTSNTNAQAIGFYPKEELSDNESTMMNLWKYVGGLRGYIKTFLELRRTYEGIYHEKPSLIRLLFLSIVMAGDWDKTDIKVEFNMSNKPCMTSEIFPNENQARIFLCALHPEYPTWWGGYLEESEDTDNNFRGGGYGFYTWRGITPPNITPGSEDTHSWWIVRRAVAWISKIPDSDFPPSFSD